MEDFKIYYDEELGKLDFSKFISLVITLKTVNSIYMDEIVIEYYLILRFEKLYNQFVENLFQFLYNIS